jgi:ubiquinone/menaquinone biosynthesis C-methylase UbiE
MNHKLVLDLACGTGRWLQNLVALGARSGVGVDFSAAMLRIAAIKPAIACRLTRADCTRLPFPAGLFDFAICSFALGHFHDLRAVSGEFATILRPGADLVLSDVHPDAYARGWRTGFRQERIALEIQTVHHSFAEILEQFGSSGFDCCDLLSESLGEPERPLFIRAGREHLFQSACKIPAVFIARFRRN